MAKLVMDCRHCFQRVSVPQTRACMEAFVSTITASARVDTPDQAVKYVSEVSV